MGKRENRGEADRLERTPPKAEAPEAGRSFHSLIPSAMAAALDQLCELRERVRDETAPLRRGRDTSDGGDFPDGVNEIHCMLRSIIDDECSSDLMRMFASELVEMIDVIRAINAMLDQFEM